MKPTRAPTTTDIAERYGRAMQIAQGLESALLTGLAFSMWCRGTLGPLEAFMRTHRKATLGSLVTSLEREESVSPRAAAALRELVAVRNYLAHDFYRFNTAFMSSASGRVRVYRELHRHFVQIAVATQIMNEALCVAVSKLDRAPDLEPKDLERLARALGRDGQLRHGLLAGGQTEEQINAVARLARERARAGRRTMR